MTINQIGQPIEPVSASDTMKDLMLKYLSAGIVIPPAPKKDTLSISNTAKQLVAQSTAKANVTKTSENQNTNNTKTTSQPIKQNTDTSAKQQTVYVSESEKDLQSFLAGKAYQEEANKSYASKLK